MHENEPNYRGLAVSLYDLWWTTYPVNDEEFYYQRIVQEGERGPALEVACGTGRLLVPYLQTGLEVEGVDNSMEMLAICREKANRFNLSPILYQQSMQTLDLPKQYQTIYVPFNSFQILYIWEEALEALNRFYKHLKPGGQLLIATYVPMEAFTGDKRKPWHIRRVAKCEDGAIVFCHQAATYDLEEQVETGYYRYEVYQANQLVETELQTMKVRWYGQHEFKLMLEKAGFCDIEMHRNYTKVPSSGKDPMIIFSARK